MRMSYEIGIINSICVLNSKTDRQTPFNPTTAEKKSKQDERERERERS